MKVLAATLLFISITAAAYDIQHFLVAEWHTNGQHFCKYDNGTVLNVGYNICPLSI